MSFSVSQVSARYGTTVGTVGERTPDGRRRHPEPNHRRQAHPHAGRPAAEEPDMSAEKGSLHTSGTIIDVRA